MTGHVSTLLGIDPLRFVARVTIECETAILVADGSERKAHDQGFVRDVHGLPMIPGTSIAGILSHAIDTIADVELKELRAIVFGTAATSTETQVKNGADPNSSSRSMASRLRVSDGYFHDASNRPVDQELGELYEDEVTRLGRQGSHRDRVRINARGTADARGKFDALLCPKGARFTFELEFVWGSPGELEDEVTRDPELGKAIWDTLLSDLAGRQTRLGQSVRSGYGAFSVVDLQEGIHWMPSDNDWGAITRPDYCNAGLVEYLTISGTFRSCPAHFVSSDIVEPKSKLGTVELANLRPEDTWYFGGGDPTEDTDITPVSEAVIAWNAQLKNQPGYVSEAICLVPASGIKGALRHRVLWHLRRNKECWMSQENSEADPAKTMLNEVFGDVKTDEGAETARPGALFFNDIYLDTQVDVGFTHNVLDRFTSGVRAGLLFSENPRIGGNLDGMKIEIDLEKAGDIYPDARAALMLALNDLCSGRLNLGGGAGRGHGAFEASLSLDVQAQEWFETSTGEQAHG